MDAKSVEILKSITLSRKQAVVYVVSYIQRMVGKLYQAIQ